MAAAVAAGLMLAAAADALTCRLADDEGAAGAVLDEVAAHPVLASASAVANTVVPNTPSTRMPVISASLCDCDECCADGSAYWLRGG
jgi:hypothetical protein